MKQLYIIRHAKSDWSNGDLSDRERPLNARGIKDAPFMAEQFHKRAGTPDLFISSPAVRAYTTCTYFCAAAQIPVNQIRVADILYFGGLTDIVHMLENAFEANNRIAIFGHNPTQSELANLFTNNFFHEMPTCAIVSIRFADGFGIGKGVIEWFDFPKNHTK